MIAEADRILVDRILIVLNRGVLEARSAGWSRDAEKAADIADVLHNMPRTATHLLAGGDAARDVDREWIERELSAAEMRFSIRRPVVA
jgi:hypothetical protein